MNETRDACPRRSTGQPFGGGDIHRVKRLRAAPRRRFGRAVPDHITALHQCIAAGVVGLRKLQRHELRAERGKLSARFAPKPAGGARYQIFHGSSTIPASVNPAAVPTSIIGSPGFTRPVVNASWSAVGIDAAT